MNWSDGTAYPNKVPSWVAEVDRIEQFSGIGLTEASGVGLDRVMEDSAAEAAALLRLLGNERRLLLLCMLISEGEAHVGKLAERVRLSQPAVSQHLAKLREDGLVKTRRTGTTIHYRIADPRVERVIQVLKDVFCP